MWGIKLTVVVICLFLLACTEREIGQANLPTDRNLNSIVARREKELMEQMEQSRLMREKESWKEFDQRDFLPIVSERLEGTEIIHLRDQVLPAGAREIRVWVGFDLRPLSGIILKQDDGKWSAIYIPPLQKKSNKPSPLRELPPPKSGWSSLWERLEGLGIYTLPDAVDIGALNTYFDARAVVIEIKTQDSYRNYFYTGLDTADAPEAGKVWEITKILSQEFAIPLHGV